MGKHRTEGPPRVRSVHVQEIELPSWAWATREDPLDRRALKQLLVGVSTRGYAGSLETAPAGIDESLSSSRSSVSRRFVGQTQGRVAGFLPRALPPAGGDFAAARV